MALDCVNAAAYPSMWRGDEGHDPLHDEPDLHGEKHRVLQPRARATEPVSGKRLPPVLELELERQNPVPGKRRVLQPRARATEPVLCELRLLQPRARATEPVSGERRLLQPRARATDPVSGE
jgi:hypothetical protein